MTTVPGLCSWSVASAGGIEVNRVATWDGTSWAPLGSGFDSGGVTEFAVFDDGTGPALYAGGNFTSAGGIEVNGVAKWDGRSWSPLGSGLGANPGNDLVNALEVYDDGDGPALYAGGTFMTAGGAPANRIAKWDGSSWSALGAGIDTHNVRALRTFDDGSGPALFVGGQFNSAGGGVPGTKVIAKWDGASWSSVGGGVAGATSFFANSLEVIDVGDGPALYMAGWFSSPGGAPSAAHFAKWDGENWSGFGGVSGSGVTAMDAAGYDDGMGDGPQIYLGGAFSHAGGVLVNKIAKWDGSQWSVLGDGVTELQHSVRALAVFDDNSGAGPALYVGGSFTDGPTDDVYLTRWQGCAVPALAMTVRLDIKPGSCPNPLNPQSQGVLPAAIAGAVGLHVSAIDPATLTISRADGVGGSVAPLMGPGVTLGSATSPSLNETCDCADSGALDDIDDLLLKFSTTALVEALALNGVSPGTHVELVVSGSLIDGTPFSGSDCVLIVGTGLQAATLLDDLFVLLDHLGSSVAPGTNGDLNGDGVVDIDDVLTLLAPR